MFDASTYRSRRRHLAQHTPGSGLALLLGNGQSPMNYADNPYPFRQDSTFLYYFGLDLPDLYGLIDLDENTTTLYAPNPGLEEVIWTGEQDTPQDAAEASGVETVAAPSALEDHLEAATQKGRPIHLLPPYRAEHRLRYESLLGIPTDQVDDHTSEPLIRAVIRQRSQKTEAEVAQIEKAVETTTRLHKAAMRRATPGTTEQQIVGAITNIALSEGVSLSFPPTCSVRGEVLHNHSYTNTLQKDDLLLLDAGATSPAGYAGDLTRVTPVGGAFTEQQNEIYEAVLAAQEAALDVLAPEVPFKDVHLHSAHTLTEHLIDLGLMKGNAEEAVAAGAHALFFPHGLGHMLGLDAHDMENLGEDEVGYADDQSRSDQFGLDALRLARPLRPGFVVTIEPGCYFIPPLVEQWRSEGRHEAFINYDRVEDFLGFGGIRIEDDVLITEDGGRILGPSPPKTPDAIEALAGTTAT